MKPDLTSIEVPGAAEAEERAARIVTAAFADWRPPPRKRRVARPIAAVAVAVALIAGVLSPPGRAFVDHVRRAVGVDDAQPALFTLPAPGRILVTAGSGTWITYADGSRRLLGTYDDASWSPFGRYIAATRAERARDARSRGNCSLDPGATRRPVPALDGKRHQHAHRLPQRRPCPRRRGRRHRRLRGGRRTRRRRSTRVELAPRVRPRLRRNGRARPLSPHGERRLALERDPARPAAVARVVERRPAAARPLAGQGLDPRRWHAAA